jgi:hypothetical protein
MHCRDTTIGGVAFRGSIFESVKLLTHAKGMVMTRSTFSIAAVLLSEYAERARIYSFAYPRADIGSYWDCRASEAFESNIMGKWNASPE